jgi:hypothetical protein
MSRNLACRLTQGGALNLALLAANLAESAGSSAISHALRAEIYACAGLRCRLCLPRWLRRIIAGYFFRRAKFPAFHFSCFN